MFKVSVYTQVYNTMETYVRQCIESVLDQTFTDFEFVILDNGCTDGTSDVLREYANKDDRIKLFRREVNEGIDPPWLHLVQDREGGEWIAPLDADDWWEPDQLEHMVALTEETGADIVCTGTIMHDVKTGDAFIRSVPKRLVFDRGYFAAGFPYYHVFMRPAWAKLFRASLFKEIILPDYANIGITYGQDTLFCFTMLRKANALVLDSSVLHHYRLNPSSVSYRYDTRRFDSDVYLYNDAIDFLSSYGSISENNQFFLYRVYLNAVNDTLNILSNSDLNTTGKINAICKILENDVSKKALILFRLDRKLLIKTFDEKEADHILKTSFNVADKLFGLLFEYLSTEKTSDNNINLISIYFCNCRAVVLNGDFSFWTDDPVHRKVLLADDRIGLICFIADLIRQKKLTKKYELESMIKLLATEDNILLYVSKSRFIRNYYDIYTLIVIKKYSLALEQISAILNRTKKGIDETLLWLYITLAAILNKTDEFLYGKLRRAGYCLYCKKYDECRTELNDLADMGVEDNDEILRIKSELEKVGK